MVRLMVLGYVGLGPQTGDWRGRCPPSSAVASGQRVASGRAWPRMAVEDRHFPPLAGQVNNAGGGSLAVTIVGFVLV